MLLGSCCPAHTSQLAGPLAGIKAHPPAATSEPKSGKLNRMPRPRTDFPPTHTTPNSLTMHYQRTLNYLLQMRSFFCKSGLFGVLLPICHTAKRRREVYATQCLDIWFVDD